MNNIDKLMNGIRDHVNKPRKQYNLMSDMKKWYKLCTSMDLVGDTDLAIESYKKLDNFDCWNGGYLFIYGLLQALFLQQDAVNSILQSLFNERIDFENNYPNLYRIREIRNSAIGHPTCRGNNKSFHFITRCMINKDGFHFSSYKPTEEGKEYLEINLLDLIAKQSHDIKIILENILAKLNTEYSNHKDKFNKVKLIDMIPENFDYCFLNLYEAHSKDNIFGFNLKMIIEIIEKVKTEIECRYDSLEAIESLNYLFNLIDYQIYNLSFRYEDIDKYDDREITTYANGLRKKLQDLKDILMEIDEEYSNY